MPIYEYRCLNCQRKISIFWRSVSTVDESRTHCTHCGSPRLARLVSRVRVIRGSSAATEPGPSGDVDDSFMNEFEGIDENDPRQLGRFMRKMATETGENMGPEFDEVVGRLEHGEDPEKIEESMGDLLGGAGDTGMMDDDMMGAPSAPAQTEEEPDQPEKTVKPQRKEPSKRTVAVRSKKQKTSTSKSKMNSKVRK